MKSILKIVRRYVLGILLLCSGPELLADASFQKKSFDIEKVLINESNNTISVLCLVYGSGLDSAPIPDTGNSKWRVDMGGAGYHAKDLTISGIEMISGNRLLLQVQNPLSKARFGLEKREFTVQYTGGKELYSAKKEVVLGSGFRFFDLRPQTTPKNLMDHLLWVFVSFLLIILGTWVMRFLYDNYIFKKKHITRFGSLEKNDKQILDPFTFLPINDHDTVVRIKDELMLLNSWKAIRKLKDPKLLEKFNPFFTKGLPRTFLGLNQKLQKSLLHIWGPLVGIMLGWVVFSLLFRTSGSLIESWLFTVFDTNGVLMSTGMAADILLGLSIAIGFGLVTAAIQTISLKNRSLYRFIGKLLKSTAMITAAFTLFVLLTFKVGQGLYIMTWAGWCLLGIAFALTLLKSRSKSQLILLGVFSGCLSFLSLLIMNTSFAHSMLGTELPVFYALLLLPISILKGSEFFHKTKIEKGPFTTDAKLKNHLSSHQLETKLAPELRQEENKVPVL